MPYPINQGAVCSVTIEGFHENQQVLSVFHYRLQLPEPLEDGRNLLDTFLTFINTGDRLVKRWKDCVSVKVAGLRVKGQWITPLRFAYISRETAPGEGAIAGDAYPVNTSAALTKQTEFSGRDQVGTLHMPGVPISFVTNGLLTPAAVGAYSLLGEELVKEYTTPLIPATFTPILFGTGNPDLADPIVGYTLKPTARVMRRRTVGVGS